jgi:hypothetical protein
MTNFDKTFFENEYTKSLNTPSHINEHLPILRELAKECNHVTEMGVHEGISTRAFLCENVVLRCYDITHYPEITNLINIAKESGKDIEYVKDDVLDITIDETDLLFIDTWHVYGQLKRELARWNSSVAKYIIMHDTTIDEWKGETLRVGWDPVKQSAQYGIPVEEITKGLWPAIEEFLAAHPEWKLRERYTNNNGLTVLERK